MSLLYNIAMAIYTMAIGVAGLSNAKARLWSKGRKGLLRSIEHTVRPNDHIVWIHAASLGEFEQGRPIIEHLKASKPDCKILLTFFSPSGYEIRKNYPLADYVFYLPADRPHNVRRFLNAVKPEVAIFIKYEFWLNYLAELRRRNIATYLVSAIFRPRSIFFRPWGKAWRKALHGYEHIFVQDSASEQLLHNIGVERVSVAGDTRFDRVRDIAREAKPIPVIAHFKGESDLLVAGSTWPKDEELLIELANRNPTIRLVIAPHEMDEQRIERLIHNIRGGARRYTSSTAESDFRNTQVLILDTIGLLSSVYAYARWAYIGGGFGVGIHNTLEAATYGLAIAFGPNYHKFQEAKDMIALGVATCVRSSDELNNWLTALRESQRYDKLRSEALRYTESRCGATQLVVDKVLAHKKGMTKK